MGFWRLWWVRKEKQKSHPFSSNKIRGNWWLKPWGVPSPPFLSMSHPMQILGIIVVGRKYGWPGGGTPPMFSVGEVICHGNQMSNPPPFQIFWTSPTLFAEKLFLSLYKCSNFLKRNVLITNSRGEKNHIFLRANFGLCFSTIAWLMWGCHTNSAVYKKRGKKLQSWSSWITSEGNI